jgi:outer membrane protein OmpA-like peptidoglycan-associated protein
MDKGVPLQKMRVEGVGERESITDPALCRDLSRDQLIDCFQRDRRVEIDAAIHRSHVRIEEGG